MGRNTRGDKEFTRLQEALHENKKLKRENNRLRKELARLDLDRHAYVKDIVDEHFAQEERGETTVQMLQKLKEAWKCNECRDGYLEIFTFNKVNETWYRRECNNCDHKTKSQKYDSTVQGIIKDEKEEKK